MIDFFTALWGQLSVLWEGFVVSVPIWIDYAIEALKALGIGGILVVIAKWVIPVLKTANDPILKKVVDLAETILALKSQVTASEARATASEVKNDSLNSLFVQYMSLSCKTNSESRTLTADKKKQYEDLANSFLAAGNTQMAETITDIIEDNVVTNEELLVVANQIPVVAEILESTPSEIISTVEKSRHKLRQRK